MIRIDFRVPAEFVEVPIGIDPHRAWAEVNARNARAKSSYGDDLFTAARGVLHGILDHRGAEWSGSLLDAPCGQIAVLVGGQFYRIPSGFTSDGEEAVVPTAQLHAVVPIPAPTGSAGQSMCLIALSTPSISHWEKCYAPIMATVLRSLRFTDVPPVTGPAV